LDDAVLFRTLAGRTTQAEQKAVDAWRRAFPEHEARYQELRKLLALAAHADEGRETAPPPGFNAEEIVRRARLLRVERERAWRLTAAWTASVAAMLMLAVLLWRLREPGPQPRSGYLHAIVTGPTDMVTVSLADGSVVRLAPRSRLQTDDDDVHQLTLDGHAYFAVAKQKSGPLLIRTPAGNVQVVGTRFDLEASSDQLRLVVVEGRVLLSAHGAVSAVSAGELGRVREGVPAPVVELPRTLPRLDWLGNFLAFESTPVREAANDIAREFGVRVVIADSALGERTVTGWFAGSTLKDVLDVVCVVANAQCTESSGVVTMRPR
jgi:transmembrane sensor